MANITFDHAQSYFTLEKTFPGSLNEIDRAIVTKSGITIPTHDGRVKMKLSVHLLRSLWIDKQINLLNRIYLERALFVSFDKSKDFKNVQNFLTLKMIKLCRCSNG